MNAREKTLAAFVGVLAIGWGGFTFAPKLMAPFEQRSKEAAKLRTQVEQRRNAISQQESAVKELKAWQEASLPADFSRTSLEYKDWIYELLKNQGFKNVVVTPNAKPGIIQAVIPGRSPLEVYRELSWTVTGQTEIAGLTRFLHAFYKRDYLHRVSSLQLDRRDGGKELGFTATITALIVPEAKPASELPQRELQRAALADVASYEKLIVERNLFSAKNSAPTFSDTAGKEATAGIAASIPFTATDPDGDKVNYQLVQGPEGAAIDANSGQLTFTPKSEDVDKELKVKIAATDNAVPPHRQEQEFTIKVKSGDAPSPGFENTKFTFITAFVERNDKPQVMVHEQPTNQVFQLHEGDEFQIGQFRGKIRHIGKLEVELESAGKAYRWSWSVSLHDALRKPLETSEQVARTDG